MLSSFHSPLFSILYSGFLFTFDFLFQPALVLKCSFVSGQKLYFFVCLYSTTFFFLVNTFSLFQRYLCVYTTIFRFFIAFFLIFCVFFTDSSIQTKNKRTITLVSPAFSLGLYCIMVHFFIFFLYSVASLFVLKIFSLFRVFQT